MFSPGFCFSAICIAPDAKLCRLLRELAANEPKWLHNIGIAEMEQKLYKRVEEILKDHHDILNEQTMFAQSFSYKENVTDYLGHVLREIEKEQQQNS